MHPDLVCRRLKEAWFGLKLKKTAFHIIFGRAAA